MRNRDHAPHARLKSEARVGLAVDRALHLFTPVGERLWVEDWAPAFPAYELTALSDDGRRAPGRVMSVVIRRRRLG